MSQPTILIRTDATTAMGMGHLSRCLTLAKALMARGAAVWFAMRGPVPEAEEMVAKAGAGLAHVSLDADLAQDLAETLAALAELKAAGAVLDGYQFDEAYYQGLAAQTCLLFFDELAEFRFTKGLVLNQNHHADELAYQAEPGVRLLLGPGFAVLRDQFAAARGQRHHPERARRLMISFGGSDPHGLTARALEGLAAAQGNYSIRAILGGGSRTARAVAALGETSPHQVKVLHQVEDMAAVMAWADMALSASGTNTTLEMSAMGVPMVLVIQAENQRLIGECMGRRGLAVQLGFWEEVTGEAMARAVDALAGDQPARQAMSAGAMAAVDGRGADRVAGELLNACGKDA